MPYYPPGGGGSGGTGTPGGSTGDVQTNAGGGNFGGTTPGTGVLTAIAANANAAAGFITGNGTATLTNKTLTSPTLTTPALGVPASGDLSNCTGGPTLTSATLVTPALGTPASGTLTNCTFPTLNQSTTGSAASLSVSGQSGLVTVAGITSTNRIKTVRDAADTVLELGGSYTPTGTWTSMTLVTPALGTPASGVLTNCTGGPTLTNATLVTPALGTPASGVLTNCTGTASGLTAGNTSANHAVYASGSPPGVDVGFFTVSKTGVDMKTAGNTTVFTVPAGRTFTCTESTLVVTSVTTGGAGTETFTIKESGAGGQMTGAGASGSTTPVVGTTYAVSSVGTGGPYALCAAGNNVQCAVSTSQAGSTAVSGTCFVTGFYTS